MKKRFHIALASFCGAFLLAGCNQQALTPENPSEGIYSLTVQMPSDSEMETKVGITLSEQNNLDLITSWQDGDKVQVMVLVGDQLHNFGRLPVTNISENRKIASVELDMRDIRDSEQPFTVYCFTGNETTAVVESVNGSWMASCESPIQRTPLNVFRVPMFSKVEATGKDTALGCYFQPYGTFEVLHFHNETESSIRFAHQGYDVQYPWYQGNCTYYFNDGFDPTLALSGNWKGNAKSSLISIPAHEEGLILSWYIPSGYRINEARLIASINGQEGIRANDFLSSDVPLKSGQAYHIHANWDGHLLKMGRPDPFEVTVTTLQATDVAIRKADISGEYTITGTENTIYEEGFVYSSTNPNPTLAMPDCIRKKADSMGSSFSATLSDLEPLTTYYVAAYVIVSHRQEGRQTCYGNVVSFVTDPLENVIPDEIVDLLDDYIPIYDGINPPVIEGQYVMSPMTLVYSTRGYSPGDTFADTYVMFYNQDTQNNTLDYKEAQKSLGEAVGTGAFISGEGNNFSVFFNTEGVSYYDYDIYTKEAVILSGIKTPTGIQNMYYAFVMLEKSDDPDSHIVPVGTYRVFKDGDNFSNTTSYFSGAYNAPGKGLYKAPLPSIYDALPSPLRR